MKKITCGICLELVLFYYFNNYYNYNYFKWFNADITYRIFKAYGKN